MLGDDVLTSDVAEIQEGGKGLDDVDGNVAFERSGENLCEIRIRLELRFERQTFMNALESFPVHC